MKRMLFRTALVAALALTAVALPGAARAAPPLNDNFANATVIDPTLSSFTDSLSNSEATTEAGEPQVCSFSPRTVWYAITPNKAETIRVGLAGSSFFDTEVNVYRQNGSDINGLAYVGCASYYGNPVTFQADAGVTYYIQASDIFTGGGTLQIAFNVIPPPLNDNFANATPATSLPYSDSQDMTGATTEPGEPLPSCGGSFIRTVWHTFTPSKSGPYSVSTFGGILGDVNVYTGTSLGALTEIACGGNATGMGTFQAVAGTTYYLQTGTWYSAGTLETQLVETPPPSVGFYFGPGDPTQFDVMQFGSQSFDPGNVGIASQTWSFGDGGSATGVYPTHRYTVDGDYTVTLTVTTTDGRVGSANQVIHVRTHDVSITKMTVPQTASTGQTRQITVGLTDVRYAETVQVILEKSVAGGGWQQVGVSTQSVPVRGSGRTTSFVFNYTFTADDAVLGKVTFRATANIQNARDAIPTDNQVISLPTRVSR